MANDIITDHLGACRAFSVIVEEVRDRWSLPTPCDQWDTGQVVEHVIGFHDVLLLRPLNAKPKRPKGNPVARWEVTVAAIESVMPGLGEGLVLAVPEDSFMDLGLLLPMLTGDVLVHTWDLARAVGVTMSFDPDLVEQAYDRYSLNETPLRTSDMFGPPIPVSKEADGVTKLVALLGRDPTWRTPSPG